MRRLDADYSVSDYEPEEPFGEYNIIGSSMRAGIFLNSANDNRFKALLFDVQWGITERVVMPSLPMMIMI
jgi:hypothetical protein